MTKNGQNNEELIAQIKLNIAFEHMVIAALSSAAITVLASLIISNAAMVLTGTWSLVGAGFSFYKAISFAGIFFLFAFIGSAAIGVPLFRSLERMRVRNVWPYVVAALVAGFIVCAFTGRFPTFDSPERFLLLAPGVITALIFGQLIRPHWRAAAARSLQVMSGQNLH